MATDIKISQMPAATSLAGDELIQLYKIVVIRLLQLIR